MPDGLPHDILVAVGGAGGLAAIYTLVRIVSAIVATIGGVRKTTDEAATARLLGDKAVAEARTAGVMELAAIVGQLRSEVDSQRAELDAERTITRRWSAAMLEFIGVVSRELREMPDDMRARIEAALDRLRAAVGWVGFGDGR